MKTLMKRDYICVSVFYVLFVSLFSIVENTSVCKGAQGTEVIDNNEWIYGTWECQTQYGTMRLIINDDGRMYDSVEERWCSYSIEGDEIVEHILDGLVSTYHIDRVNKRFDCGNNRDWFIKVSNHQQNVSCASQEQYNTDIDELENLVSEIVRLEYQYMETRDESIAERGEKLCAKLRDISYSLENKVNEGKLSMEQQERINEILKRLPQ